MRQQAGVAAHHAAGDDRDLVHRVEVRQHARDQRVADLVVGRDRLLAFADDAALALRAGDDAVDRLLELGHADRLLVAAGGQDGGLVEQVGQVGAARSRASAWPAMSRLTFLSSGLPRACTSRIALRPLMSGRSSTTWRSKRPGRSSAGSSTSGRLVAAMTITLVLVSKPSISTRIWFSVCSRSSWLPPRPAPRWRPTASISSTKTMQGALRLAWSNRSRTRLAPTPTNISTNSEPEMREERHARLAGHGARQQRLAGARRADQQHAARNARAERRELLGVLQELDHLGKLLLGLLDAGHVARR